MNLIYTLIMITAMNLTADRIIGAIEKANAVIIVCNKPTVNGSMYCTPQPATDYQGKQ